MSRYFELRIGEILVTYITNYFDSSLLLPFQTSDLTSTFMTAEEEGALRFDAPARVVGRRLDLLGHTLTRARAVYARSIGDSNLRRSYPEYNWPLTLADWQRGVAAAATRVQADRFGSWSPEKWVWDDILLGFPGGGLWEVVRALADAQPDATVSLDLTDLARGGYVDDATDLSTGQAREPLIILTEGKSDARLLRNAIDVLFPDYSEFIRFVDYDFAKASGGVHEVVRFVKMFCGAGIKNRIVALFDNDTAGHEACQQLMELPANVFPMCLPTLELFRRYPTIGPDGETENDIDGRACSIELYLGRQALSDVEGKLRPVRWAGFNEKMKRYQGAVSEKNHVQVRFEEILEDKIGRAHV